MTTIILTIIGILLAAAAALMVIFYGGDAFNSGSVGAQANTVQNAGTNVISAVQMYKAERAVAPTDLASLQDASGPAGKFLDSEPALPTGLNQTLAGTLYSVDGVALNVCERINKNLKITAPTDVDDVQKMGCVAGTTTGVFYSKA